nr:IclR family transcriptional regulator [Neobacillus sp. Marseille-Q6967]
MVKNETEVSLFETKGGIIIEQNIKTVEKALRILEAIADKPKTFFEIIDVMNSNKATIHRFVTTLEKQGYIFKNQYDRYQLTQKLHSLGKKGIEQYNLLEIAKPFLINLAYKANESAVISSFEKDKVYYLDKIESPSALRIVVESGKAAPLYCVASGKLYLAHLEEDELEAYFTRQPLTAITKNTITSINQMKTEIKKIREQGFAIDHEEWEEYLRGVAFPIYDYSNKMVAALSIAGVSYRFTLEKVYSIVGEATEIAKKISRLLGYVEQK